MRDPNQSTFAFVMYPEATPILEAWRAARNWARWAFIPAWWWPTWSSRRVRAVSSLANNRRLMQEKYLVEMVERFGLPVAQIPLLPKEIKGLPMLAEIGERIYGTEKVLA